jgi:DNA-binding CsgD family transcriptional regulator
LPATDRLYIITTMPYNTLTSKQIKLAYMLLGECRMLGKKPIDWLPHLHKRLNEIMGIQYTCVMEADRDVALALKSPAREDCTLEFGSTRLISNNFQEFLRTDSIKRGVIAPFIRSCREKTMLISNTQYVSLARWQDSANYRDFYRPSDLEHLLHCRLPVSGNRYMLLSFWRFRGDKPFNERDIAFTDLIRGELASMLACGELLELKTCPISCLSPRIREVACLLCDGMPEKQVAYKLGIKESTCHDYVKALYKELNVSSRTELILKMKTHS